jgi:hypothetical protein
LAWQKTGMVTTPLPRRHVIGGVYDPVPNIKLRSSSSFDYNPTTFSGDSRPRLPPLQPPTRLPWSRRHPNPLATSHRSTPNPSVLIDTDPHRQTQTLASTLGVVTITPCRHLHGRRAPSPPPAAVVAPPCPSPSPRWRRLENPNQYGTSLRTTPPRANASARRVAR